MLEQHVEMVRLDRVYQWVTIFMIHPLIMLVSLLSIPSVAIGEDCAHSALNYEQCLRDRDMEGSHAANPNIIYSDTTPIPDLKRDPFEYPKDFRTRLRKLPLPAGTAALLKEKYDVVTGIFPITVQWQEWTKPYLTVGEKLIIQAKRDLAKPLYEKSSSHPVFAWLQVSDDGKITIDRLELYGLEQVFSITSETQQSSKTVDDVVKYMPPAPPKSQVDKSFQDKLKDGGLGPEMVQIPAGMFQMGSNDGEEDEKPVHMVSIKSFAMGKYEVTFAEYDKFCEATGRSKPNSSKDGERGYRPVINTSWEDAKAYVKWLSEQTGKDYHLPSESQWEYACRAGTSTPYWWGDDIRQNNANCDGCGSPWDNKQTALAVAFKPNPFGLYNMNGNVWEWVEDVYHKDYNGVPNDENAWTSGQKTNQRVLRGGSWSSKHLKLRCSYRGADNITSRYNNWGFRVSRI